MFVSPQVTIDLKAIVDSGNFRRFRPIAGDIPTIVAGEYNQCIIHQVHVFQCFDDPSDGPVQVLNKVTIRPGITQRPHIIGRSDRVMYSNRSIVQKERLVTALLFDPVD